ncbi:MAG TPA: tetratricopeptide repeat protein [Kamptonema sp.]|nr:tetratricopeptide repeat protein [Kamptonema sp.]
MLKNNKHLASLIHFTGISLSIFAGVGISTFALVKPAASEPLTLQIAQNTQPRRGQPAREVIFYEMDRDEVKICKQTANASKKCEVVGKGYSLGLRTANDLYGQGNIANAEALFRQLIARFPKQAEAYYKLGSILSSQDKVEDAIAQYRQAIQINPQHAKAHNDLAVALANQSKLDEAITVWRQAIKINAEYADALNNLGLALLQQGQKEQQQEAIANLTKARDLFIKQGKVKQASRIDQILQEVNQQLSGS